MFYLIGTIAEDELIPFLTNADLVHEDTEDSLLSEKTVGRSFPRFFRKMRLLLNHI